MRLKVVATLLFVSACVLAGSAGRVASAQRNRAPAASNDNAAQAPQNNDRPKHVFIGRGSDTERGSRMTVTSDNPLNDYRAYRSGDRFYVELPNANADAAARASGRGFSDMQVQRRGKSVVLSYRIQPGAKPHVEQRFNRLDVIFDAPEGEQGGNAAANNASNGGANAAQNRTPTASEQPAGQNPPAQQNPSATAAERRAAQTEASGQAPAAGGTQAGGAGQAGVVAPPSSLAGEQPSQASNAGQPPGATPPTAEQTPAAAPAPTAEQQIAQAQPPAQIAPITAGGANSGAQSPGASLGTFLLRNWTTALIIAFAVAGLGLILAARRSNAPSPSVLGESSVATARALDEARASQLETAELRRADADTLASKPAVTADAFAPRAAAPDALPLVAASALVAGAAVEEEEPEAVEAEEPEVVEEAKEPEEREEPAEEWAAEPSLIAAEPSHAVVETPAAESVAEPPVSEVVPEPPVAETFVEASAVEAVAEQPAVEEAVAESAAGLAVEEEAAVEEPTAEIAHVASEGVEEAEPEAVAEAGVGAAAVEEVKAVRAVAPAAPDHETVEAETKRLLEGGDYDRAVVGTTDSLARQLVAAELLSALAGRNPERRERARTAFIEHGYFDEKAYDLRRAQAPAERAAAARSLAVTGDRAATPHLVAALEDDSAEVRRAAVEGLGSLRDPAAAGPLASLLDREKGWRNRVPGRVIRHALDTCREAEAEERAAAQAQTRAAVEEEKATSAVETAAPEAAEVSPAAESGEATLTAEPHAESAVAEAASGEVGIAPAAEAAEEASVMEAPSVFEEMSVVALAPVADEVAEPEEVTALEAAPAVEEEVLEAEAGLHALEPAAAEPPADVSEVVTGVEPFAEVHALETAGHEAEAERAVEPAAAFEQAELFRDVGPAQETQEIAPARAEAAEAVAEESVAEETSAEIIPVAAGEWFDFDLSSGEPETRPAAEREVLSVEPLLEPDATESRASLLEPTSVEAVTPEVVASEAAPAAESARGVEHFAGEAAETETAPRGFDAADAAAISEAAGAAPPAARTEKGVAPFDELSTVPASIQQRLASRVPAERAAAIVELSHVDTDEAFQQICAGFDDEAKEVRSAAARALYELRADRAESFTRALREATPERRRHIGAAIASSGLANDAVSQLTGESREKTYEAFSLLFLMAKAGEVYPLIRAIESHHNSEVRLAVVKLLALSGQKEILPAFRRLAVRGSLPTDVRSAVMEAIYQISSSQPSAA